MRGRIHSAAALVGVAALALTACGDDSNDDDDAAATTVADEPSEDDSSDEMADDDMAGEPGTIVDVAASTDGFSTLVAAVEAAGLVETLSGEGPFTVFAPTDDAFADALAALDLTADELLADTETLTSILTYHVVPGEVPSSDVVTLDGESVETVNGATVEITVDGDTVMVNDATVTAVDVEASNGVIHVIDAVLLPPSGDDMADDDMSEESMSDDEMAEDDMSDEEMADGEVGTIVDVASSTDDFSTLVAAVAAAGLVETLDGEGPFTVFAPTDAAFADALDALALSADDLLADPDTLTSILTYHVIEGEVPSSDVVTLDGESVETVNGATVEITVDGDTVMVNDATVTTVDVEASNGVIHVIDAVLLPPES